MSLFTFDELKDVASGATPMNLLTFLTDMLDFDHQDDDYDWQWGWESNVANWLWDENNNAIRSMTLLLISAVFSFNLWRWLLTHHNGLMSIGKTRWN